MWERERWRDRERVPESTTKVKGEPTTGRFFNNLIDACPFFLVPA